MKKRIILVVIFVLVLVSITGCTKDEILGQYNDIIQIAGGVKLTDDFRLKGVRKYGIDHYTGNYKANYNKFTGTEYLFGGTSINRENGNKVIITCDINSKKGSAKLILLSGSNGPKILCKPNDNYSKTITLPAGGNYIGIECNSFSGTVKLNIE